MCMEEYNLRDLFQQTAAGVSGAHPEVWEGPDAHPG